MRRLEAAAFVGDLDQERAGREGHPDPADPRARVAPHVGERLAHDLVHNLALLGRQHVLGSVARDLDADRVEAGELAGLHAQVAQEAFRSDRPRPQLGQRLAHLLEHPLEDPEHAAEHLVFATGFAETGTSLRVRLEKRDGRREVGGDAVVELARHASPLAVDRLFAGLSGRRAQGGRGLWRRSPGLADLRHRAALRRRYEPRSATTSGCCSQRRIRRYGCHSFLVSSIASLRRAISAWRPTRSLSMLTVSARMPRPIATPHTATTAISMKITSTPATSSQMPIVPRRAMVAAFTPWSRPPRWRPPARWRL